MTESLPQLHEPGTSSPAFARPSRRRWQIGLRTFFLLMAAIAVWMSYFINRRDIASLKERLETTVPLAHQLILEARIETMAPLAHELIVDDPTQIAVVKLKEHRFDDNRWEIYLPDGTYRLCLATRGITYAGLTPERKSVPITAGRHQLALEQQFDQEVWHITALWDHAKLIGIEETKDWGEHRTRSAEVTTRRASNCHRTSL